MSFLKFNYSKVGLNHSCISKNTLFVLILKPLRLRLVAIILVSSAYRVHLAFLVVILCTLFILKKLMDQEQNLVELHA